MKNTTIPVIFTLAFILSFFALNSLQAQQMETYAAFAAQEPTAEPSASEPAESDAAEKPANIKLDFAAGQQPPAFENLEEYVATNLSYPAKARKTGLEGSVKLLLTISPKGEITEAKVIESLGRGCDEAALKMLQSMPQWIPAKNYGLPVKGKKILDIVFRIR